MAASIENRVPFATPQILSIALSLPRESRATVFGRKLFLKSCLNHYIPKKYSNRRKWGFGIPLGCMALPSRRDRALEIWSHTIPLCTDW